jgi:glutamate-1-semialdehyde 2,1-aminomutase
MTDLFRRTGTPAIVQRVGPIFQILFTHELAIWNYRQYCEHVDRKQYQRFSLALFEHGIYTSPAATLHSIVTAAHSRENVAQTLAAMENVLEKIG